MNNRQQKIIVRTAPRAAIEALVVRYLARELGDEAKRRGLSPQAVARSLWPLTMKTTEK